jgi:outer membrane protein with beta-barrel domain
VSRPAIAICVAVLAGPPVAHAQFIGRDLPRAGTFEISGGGLWTGSSSFATVLANETRNPATGSQPLTLFQGERRLDSGAGAEAHLGLYFGRRVSIEGGLQFSRPSLTVRTSSDFEGAPDTTAASPIAQFVVGGSLLYHFGAGRVVPFASVGAGYFRQALENNSIVETGNEIHGGAGLKYWFGGRRRSGIRAEARASARSGGISLDGSTKRRVVPTVSAGFTYLF